MDLGSVQWLAVLVAVVIVFMSGMLWFSQRTLFPVWWRAMGKSPEDMAGGGNMKVLFGSTIIAAFVQAFGVAIVIGLREQGGTHVGPIRGLVIGAVIGILFAAATSLSHRLFAGQGFKVWAIEAGGDIAGLAAMGLVIGAF